MIENGRTLARTSSCHDERGSAAGDPRIFVGAATLTRTATFSTAILGRARRASPVCATSIGDESRCPGSAPRRVARCFSAFRSRDSRSRSGGNVASISRGSAVGFGTHRAADPGGRCPA